jgi:hypothetical protein
LDIGCTNEADICCRNFSLCCFVLNVTMQNLHTFIKFLGIKKPVVVRINTRNNKHFDGLYIPRYSSKTAKLLEHKITIHVGDNARGFDALLAHELIHAWQEEHGKTEIHGRHFKRLAKAMAESFGIEEIYLKGVEKN